MNRDGESLLEAALDVAPAATMPALLDHWASKQPDKAFVKVAEGDWRTYGQVRAQSSCLANGLRSRGISRGDRIAVILPNSEEFVDVIYACARLGAIQVPLNTSLRGEFLRYQLAHSQARLAITDALGLAQIARVADELPDLEEIVVVDEPASSQAPRRLVPFSEVVAAGSGDAHFDAVDEGELYAILYTSGTTGMPKGCLISHRSAVTQVTELARAGFLAHGDVLISAFPLFHNGGQVVAMGQTLLVGASFVSEPVFSASRAIDRARDTGATVMFGMGAMAMAILAQPAKGSDRDHRVRHGLLTPMTAAKQQEFEARFGIHVIAEHYGQTEWNPMALSAIDGERRPGSAGRPTRHVEMQIVDDDDVPVAAGAVGEIVTRPRRPGVMFEGYWNDPGSTVKTFRNLWYHTGDYGRIDEDGFLYFVDRKKDAIRRRGELVSSQELEAAIVKHPQVQAVAVVAVPSELTEDDIKAFIVPASSAPSAQDLFDFFAQELPYFAIPRYVELVEELPTNASVRVVKHQLRARGHSSATWDLEALGLVVAREDRRK